MDFLDPKKRLQHTVILFTGYLLIGVAIVIATIILLYQAYGFGLGKNGTVIQNGLLFFSSQPHPAQIILNGTPAKVRTNSRLVVPAGIYKVQISRAGYRSWQRTIEVDGGSVQHYDYPFLIPTTLASAKLQAFTTAPALATQSPDRRWLMIEQPDSLTDFSVRDLKNPTKAPVTISLPANLITKGGSESWTLDSWADDNQHVVLIHSVDGKAEYVLLDRAAPEQSINLSQTLGLGTSAPKLTLIDKKYDQYYLYTADGLLQTASLRAPTAVTILAHVLAFQSYGNDTILYATAEGQPAGKVAVKLQAGSATYTVRTLPAGSPAYLLDLTKYSGVLYVAVGATSDSRIYIYKDPVGQLAGQTKQVAVPLQVLHVTQPNYLSFSSNAQFIVAENGQQFGVYDIENSKGYIYSLTKALDAPQAHASWMDGNRLTYVSNGTLQFVDYDSTNQQALVPMNPAYVPFFGPDYRYVYELAPAAAGSADTNLNQTALLLPADL